jgi:hypothetical protein
VGGIEQVCYFDSDVPAVMSWCVGRGDVQMKEVFEQLKQRLLDNKDHFYFEDVDGDMQFDGAALFSEIDGFAEEFIKKIN